MAFELRSSAFSAGEAIPDRYTCAGADVSPPLEWANAPEETREFALVCEDPDAPGGTFTHWVLYSIPADRNQLPEDVPAESELPWGGVQGRNDFGNFGYGGPCPPIGEEHRYFFRLYALDRELDIPPGASRNQLLREIEDQALARAGLQGTFTRQVAPGGTSG